MLVPAHRSRTTTETTVFPTTLCTDHIAWTTADDGRYRLLADDDGNTWLAAWTDQGLQVHTAAGGAEPPVPSVTAADDLPARAPAQLTDALTTLGTVQRLANPSLWDALSTAIMRQVIRAGTARQRYQQWARLHGTPHTVPGGPTVYCAPGPRKVMELPAEEFTAAGIKFFYPVLRAAAHAYLEHGDHWRHLDGDQMVKELLAARVPRLGPWTVHTAVADYTGRFDLYPHDDLAVRTWANKAAPGVADISDGRTFAHRWSRWADTPSQLHALTLFTLTWGSHAPGPRNTTTRP